MEWVPVIFLAFKGGVLFTGMFFAIKWHYDQDRKDEDETHGPQSRTEMRLFATMIVALAVSLIGIVYAGCWGQAAEGGRGGALALAFVFFMLCMPKPAADKDLTLHVGQAGNGQGDRLVHAQPATLSESLDQLATLKNQTEQWHSALAIRLASVEREKIYACVAIAASALAWKFGDIVAAWFTF